MKASAAGTVSKSTPHATRRTRSRCQAVSLATLALFLFGGLWTISSQAAVAYVYTYLPTLPGMRATDINDNGQIVGSYCPTATGACNSFLYQNGTYTYFNPPTADANGSGAYKINNDGTIFGGYQATGASNGVGYIKSGSIFTDLNAASGTDTVILGGANNGAVSGFTTTGTSSEGFIRTSATGPIVDIGTNLAVWGINSFGQAVYSNVFFSPGPIGQQRSYLYSNGVSSEIVLPGAVATGVADINDAGQIVGSFRTANKVTTGFIATNGTYGLITPQHGGAINLYGINDLGQVIGYESHGSVNGVLQAEDFYVTPANLPTSIVNGAFTFNVSVIGGVPVFIDPLVAIGYDYAIGAGDPDFQTVRLPVGIGDDLYQIILPNGNSFVVSGGQLFDFTAHGYANGLANFSVRGIELDAALDPTDANAFVTALTFVGDGTFTGTMTPFAVAVTVPESETLGLLAIGTAAIAWQRRRRPPLGRALSA